MNSFRKRSLKTVDEMKALEYRSSFGCFLNAALIKSFLDWVTAIILPTWFQGKNGYYGHTG